MSVELHDTLLRSQYWRERLYDLTSKHRVPGAQVGIIALNEGGGHDVRVASIGTTSLSTGITVTDDTIFQYGSITKVWTTTLIMQLVDEGRLTLATKVLDILPDFRLADEDAAADVDIEQLLTHTSGIDGDLFTDTGDGDDCIEKYVASLAEAESITKPGRYFSYCNSGFVVAGRIIEVLREMSWDDAVVKYLFEPLDITHAVTTPKNAPLFRTAVGHIEALNADGTPRVAVTNSWMLPRSVGAAGSITGSMESLLKFAAAHLRDGVALNGRRVVSEESARLMRRTHFDRSSDSRYDPGWGLGWSISAPWGGQPSVHHGGATIGQRAQLYLLPGLGIAIGVLTNSGRGVAFSDEFLAEVATELHLTYPATQADEPSKDVDLSDALGVYETSATRVELYQEAGGQLMMAATDKSKVVGEEPDPDPEPVTALTPTRFQMVTSDGMSTQFGLTKIDGVKFLSQLRLLEYTGGPTR